MTAMKPWREVLKVHPASELFPLMSKDELKALAKDIQLHGLRLPVTLITDASGTSVLDGRNRLDALELNGEEITLDNDEIFCDAPDDPVAYVIGANIHRRHLTAEQRRDLIAKLLKATPEKSNGQVAEQVKASPTTVGAVRSELEATDQIGQLKKTVGKDGKARSTRPTRGGERRAARKAHTAAMVAESKAQHSSQSAGAKSNAPSTSALLKGQEQHVLDQQLPETRRAIERLVEYAASCNRAAEVIRELRALLDQLDPEFSNSDNREEAKCYAS
jgi:hypothetical protein